jgi:hypothetical protein
VTRVRLSRIFWLGAAAILVAAALVALAAVVRGDFSGTDARILVTLAALLYTGGAALAGLALGDRGPTRPLGWAVAAAAPVCLAFILWAVWSWVGDGGGDEDADRLAWSAVIALLAGLIATTGLLLARRRVLERLAMTGGIVAGFAAALSIGALWTDNPSDTLIKVFAALWILAALGYFLVPVLQRFSNVGAQEPAVRVLAELDGVEAVASTGPIEGVSIEPPARGERLVLRRRP